MENRVLWFHVLGFLTTGLSLIGLFFSIGKNWNMVAGIAVAACLTYEIRIRLIRPLVK